MSEWRKNRATKRPFIVHTVKREFAEGDPRYGEVLGESRYNYQTGQMEITYPTGEPVKPLIQEHELGHLIVQRYFEDISDKEEMQAIGEFEEVKEEHADNWWRYGYTYTRDNVDEAIAETFVARRFGWRKSKLGFNPAIGTPKIWAFVNMVAERYEH